VEKKGSKMERERKKNDATRYGLKKVGLHNATRISPYVIRNTSEEWLFNEERKNPRRETEEQKKSASDERQDCRQADHRIQNHCYKEHQGSRDHEDSESVWTRSDPT